MIFYLGTHHPNWLADPRFADVPLFVSRRSLSGRRTLPRAVGRCAVDSGGFIELQLHGRWTITPEEYAAEVRRYQAEIGGLDFAASIDWMCEQQVIEGLVERVQLPRCPTCPTELGKRRPMPVVRRDDDGRPWFRCSRCGGEKAGAVPAIHPTAWRAWAGKAGPVLARAVATFDRLGLAADVVFHGTGLSIAEHQRRTVESYCALREIAPDLPIAPVLQGWTSGDYLDCLELYELAGVDLGEAPVVGVGTMCRRQATIAASRIFCDILREWERDHGTRLPLHGFGLKTQGLRQSAQVWSGDAPTTLACLIDSGDSMAWSEHAAHQPPMPGHTEPGPGRPRGHQRCVGCADFALMWRERVLAGLEAEPLAA